VAANSIDCLPVKRPIKTESIPASTQFVSEDARVRSFDNEKLLIGVTKLAANGLYRVPKQDVLVNKEKPGPINL